MSDVRIQVATYKVGQVAADHIVNTVYFRDVNVIVDGPDWDNLAISTRDVFKERLQHPPGYVVEATAYDLGDAKPRPIKGFAPPAAVTQFDLGPTGPREVALCLSYYSGRNLPRSRGRIYIGPFSKGALDERPNQGATMNNLKQLAIGLTNVGGIDVDWSLFSPTDGALKKITNYWIDDEWDTMRSRGMKSTFRLTAPSGE